MSFISTITPDQFASAYRISDGRKFRLRNIAPNDTAPLEPGFKDMAPQLLRKGVDRLRELQERLYAQDTWKASPSLTLNYGLRWEPAIAQQIRNGAIYNFDVDRFLAGQKVFDDHRRAGLAELLLAQHTVERLLGVRVRCSDDHAFAGSQPICFDDNRRRACACVVARGRKVRERTVRRRRDRVPAQEVLREGL